MAAVRFSLAAVLHTIRLCIDRLELMQTLRYAVVRGSVVRFLRLARWH